MAATKINKKNSNLPRPSRDARLVIYVTEEMKTSIDTVAAKVGDTTSQYMFSLIRTHLKEKTNG